MLPEGYEPPDEKYEPGKKHKLTLSVVGNLIKVYLDDKPKITATDSTFKDAGRAGLGTNWFESSWDNFVVYSATPTP